MSAIQQSTISATALALGMLIAHGAQAQDRARTFSEMTPAEIQEILRKAKPAPTTVPPPSAIRRLERNAPVAFDPKTGREIPESLPRSGPLSREKAVPENPGSGAPRGSLDPALGGPEQDIKQALKDTTPTKPSPTTDTLTFPRRTVQKLLMRFDVNGTNYYYVCSASSRGSFHLLTAGHCVYNWDPNDDGNTADRRWANEIWAWSGQTDVASPFGVADYPYGRAYTIWMRSYTNWTQNADFDYDYALITMDRRVGDRTGWMGIEYNVTASALNFTGYPTETPYVPAGTILQYPGFDANNVDEYYTRRIALDAYLYGGHSGGPAYRYDSGGGTRYVQGINSTSDRVGNAGLTRITDYMFNDIKSAMATDATTRPPTAQPNMIEYVWQSGAKDLLTNSVQQGGTIQLKWNTLNAGFATSSTVYIDAYLSTDTTITTGDRFIGSHTVGTVPAWEFRTGTTSFTVPASTPVGSYRVGWIMRTSVDQDPGDNSAVIANEFLQVTSGSTAPGPVALLDPQGSIKAKKPKYSWLAAPAGSGWATSYELEVSEKGGGKVFALTRTASVLGCSAGGTCSIKPSEPLDPGRFTWKVRGSNAVGSGPYSKGKFRVKKS